LVTENSIRQRVYRKWVENPYLKPKQVCYALKLNYRKHGNYVKKLLSEFRSYHKFVLPQEAHLPHKRVFVWDCVPRELLRRRLGLGVDEPDPYRAFGWVMAANRNRMYVFRDDRGTVHWYKGGLVRLYLRGPVMLARAKELFCRAFSFLSDEELSRFVDVPLREESRHWVFDLGAPVPRFDIRKFERSHGIRIFADGSHPTAIEVEESTPFWLSKLEKTQELFADNIEKHVQVQEVTRKLVETLIEMFGVKPEKKRVEKPPWEI